MSRTAMYIKISLVSCFLASYLFCDKDRAVTKACSQTSLRRISLHETEVCGRQSSSEQVVCHSSASHLSAIQNTSRLES